MADFTPGTVTVAEPETYFEQIVPLGMNLTKTINTTKGDKIFIPVNTRHAEDLLSSLVSKVQKAQLLILGDVHNLFDGVNKLSVGVAKENRWQWDLNNGGWTDLLVGSHADGQMKNEDWYCETKGSTRGFPYTFTITSGLIDVDGYIGLKLKDGLSDQDSFKVTIDTYLKILWRL